MKYALVYVLAMDRRRTQAESSVSPKSRWDMSTAVRTFLFLLLASGCTRNEYRNAADSESYCLINSRQSNPLWQLPNRRVEPSTNSRLYVGAENDCGPKPLDDASAKRFMDNPDCRDNTRYYSKIPTRDNFENSDWYLCLQRNEAGNVELTQQLANELALLHSREYQTAFENVYLQALNLSSNRFEFDTQWFGGTGGGFTATGSDLGDLRRLNVTLHRLGFSRNLAGGGQVATSLLNNLVWDFGSGGIQAGSASLVSTFTQPLLRNAFRHVRLENLTQAERNLLYEVRDFARFRRNFYLQVTSSYLSLLGQAQAIRNLETNVENLRQNLVEYDDLVKQTFAAQIQRDQVFQQYQNGRLSLLNAQQNLAASLDQFKFQLGLPAWVPLEVDESLLSEFELADVRLVEMQNRSQELDLSLRQFLDPEIAPEEVLLDACSKLNEMRDELASIAPQLQNELAAWAKKLEDIDLDRLTADDQIDLQQQVSSAERIENDLTQAVERLNNRRQFYVDLVSRVRKLYQDASQSQPAKEQVKKIPTDRSLSDAEIEELLSQAERDPRIIAWDQVQEAVGTTLTGEIVELYTIQTQIRLYLIDIDQISQIKSETAVSYALQNRLDLMNSQATVMDAFRRVEVAADALESDLSLAGTVAIGSDPGQNSPYRFDSSGNTYQLGVQFDGPLNRLNERNAYRQSQIAYQVATRNFMANRDQVANEVRDILRQLELSRLSFQISRQQVVAATRQADEAQINIRTADGSSESVTLFLLQALQGILDAKNNLISNWTQYRIQKMRLYVALELLYLDDTGQWLNEGSDLSEVAGSNLVDPKYFPLPWLKVEPEGVPAGSEAPTQTLPPPQGTPNQAVVKPAEVLTP